MNEDISVSENTVTAAPTDLSLELDMSKLIYSTVLFQLGPELATTHEDEPV